MMTREAILAIIYNLILNTGTRKWEREQLILAKNAIENQTNIEEELQSLIAIFRPLALRNNLTPDVADFYGKITNDKNSQGHFDFSKHQMQVSFEKAVFAGGCFWCMVEPFETQKGIVSVMSVYTGGDIEKPTYDQVSSGASGHVEAVEIIFDPQVISYQALVELYWKISDPTDAQGQFQDRGSQYRPIIFFQNERQRQIAEKSKQKLIDSKKYQQPIVTEIRQVETFWPAENYHQKFYLKQDKRYKGIKRERQQRQKFIELKNKISGYKKG